MTPQTVRPSDLSSLTSSLDAVVKAPTTGYSGRQRKTRRFSIKYISVVHYTKLNGKIFFVCRILGDNHTEYYNVNRSWDQFIELQQRLLDTLLPDALKQLPRLNKKLALFVTKSTLTQRNDDLDLWVRRLYEVDEVKRSSVFVDFFSRDDTARPPPLDLNSNDSTVRPAQAHASRPSLPFATRTRQDSLGRDLFLASPPASPILLGRPPYRPGLHQKRSTPNLRQPEELDHYLPATPTVYPSISPSSQATTPLAGDQAFASGPLVANEQEWQALSCDERRPISPTSRSIRTIQARHRASLDSLARSFSTDHTVTPQSFLAGLDRDLQTSVDGDEEDEQRDSPPPELPIKMMDSYRPKHLRHFASLQDIRQNGSALPLPFRAPQQYLSRSSSLASNCIAPTRSIPSTPAQSHFVYPDQINGQSRKPTVSAGTGHPFRGHKSTGSGSSTHSTHSYNQSNSSMSSSVDIASSVTSFDQGEFSPMSSNGDSFAYSSNESFTMPATPETPWMADSPTDPKIDDHSWANGNLVPLPASFTFGSPRGASSRSRSGSLAQRPGLKSIAGSPPIEQIGEAISPLPSPNTTSADMITVKVRHANANIVLKVMRSATLHEMEDKVAEKLRAAGAELDRPFVLRELGKSGSDVVDALMQDASQCLRTDADWKRAAGTKPKVVLVC